MKKPQIIVSFLAALIMTSSALASTNTSRMISEAVSSVLIDPSDVVNINRWVEGDTTSYRLSAGFVRGTLKMTVKSVSDTDLVITQEMALGPIGGQSCDMYLDTTTGETKKMVCNGQEQNVAKPEVEIIETRPDTVTVPAGSFNATLVRLKEKSSGNEIQQWIHPKVPVTSMVKSITPSPFGKITLELTTFVRK